MALFVRVKTAWLFVLRKRREETKTSFFRRERKTAYMQNPPKQTGDLEIYIPPRVWPGVIAVTYLRRSLVLYRILEILVPAKVPETWE